MLSTNLSYTLLLLLLLVIHDLLYKALALPTMTAPPAGAIFLLLLAASISSAKGFDTGDRMVVEMVNGREVVDDDGDRMAVRDEKYRWPGGKIPFKMDPSVEVIRPQLELAISYWNENTCVTIYEDKDVDENQRHIYVKSVSGCRSIIGYNQSSPEAQLMSLQQPSCNTPGQAAHEFGHVIGLWHEHMRPDAMSHFNYFPQNVAPNKRSNFVVMDDASINSFGLPYDYHSIMQYPADMLTANGRLVLVPKDPLAIGLMGNQVKPNFQDYETVNLMYHCTDKCEGTKCSNGGYGSWDENSKGCRCMCPEGWRGATCEEASPDDEPCVFNVTTSGTMIRGPGFPQPTEPLVDCAWLITPPPGKQLRLSFSDFWLLPRYTEVDPSSFLYMTCPMDYLRIRTGDLLSDEPGEMFCWKDLQNRVITRGSGQTLLHLHTDVFAFGRLLQAEVTFF